MGTFSDIGDEVLTRLEESTSAPTHWTRAEVDAAINEAQDEVCEAVEWFEDRVAVPLQPRTYYDIRFITRYPPLRVTRIYDVTHNRWLTAASHRSLAQFSFRWESETGTEPDRWFTRSPFIIGIHPKLAALAWPTGQISNTWVHIHYKCLRPAVSGSGSLGVQRRFERAYIEFALYDLSMQDGEVKLGLRFWQRFLSIMGELGVQYDKPDIHPRRRGYVG